MDTKEETLRSVQRALELNRSLQSELRLKLEDAEKSIYAVRLCKKRLLVEHRRLVQTTRERMVDTKTSTGTAKANGNVQLYSYFADNQGNIPPPNPDTLAHRRVPPIYYKQRRWTKDESAILRRAVRNCCAQYVVINRIIHLNRVSSLTDQELSDLTPTDDIDWDQVARVYLPGRSQVECKTQWCCWDDVQFKQGPVTEEELNDLVSMAEKFNEQNWMTIVHELKEKRSAVWAFQTYSRYLKAIGRLREKRRWEKWEDNLLIDAVATLGTESWTQVSMLIGTRDSKQVLHRWKALDPAMKRGKWDEEEDKVLRDAVAAYGKCWSDVAKAVPGRTDAQCRERWENSLKDGIVKSEWTNQENNQLLYLVSHYGMKWASIVKELPGRTDYQIAKQYGRLRLKIEAGELPRPNFSLPIDARTKQRKIKVPETISLDTPVEIISDSDENGENLDKEDSANDRDKIRRTQQASRSYGPAHDMRFLLSRLKISLGDAQLSKTIQTSDMLAPTSFSSCGSSEAAIATTLENTRSMTEEYITTANYPDLQPLLVYKPFTPNIANMTALIHLLSGLDRHLLTPITSLPEFDGNTVIEETTYDLPLLRLPSNNTIERADSFSSLPALDVSVQHSPEFLALTMRIKLVFTYPIIMGTISGRPNEQRALDIARMKALLHNDMTVAEWKASKRT